MASPDQIDLQITDGADPIILISEWTGRSSEVCDLLEALADDLPRRPAPIWREARRLCRSVLNDHFRIMSDLILPILIRRTRHDADCQDILHRFEADYVSEKHRLIDLEDLLGDALATDTCQIGSEALGFALRSYFEALRRHINWEVDVLTPLASRKLTREDTREIENRLSARAR